MSLCIDDATLIDPAPDGPSIREGVSVFVEDGRIREIASVAPEADRRIDASGGLLLPGLVNAHTHAPMTLLRGFAEELELDAWLKNRVWPVEAHLEREHVLAGARLACAEMIEAGITAFADMYLFEDAVAQAAKQAGLACLAGASIVDGQTAEGSLEQQLSNAERLVGEHDPTRGRIRASLAPHSVYSCGPETLETVAELQQDTGARIQTHCAETRAEVYETETEHGERPVAHLAEHGCLTDATILAHGGWLTKQEAQRIGQAGASLAHCPTANHKLATGGTTPVPELIEAGGQVAVGTDGPASNNRIDVLQEARRAALAQKHHRWRAQLLPPGQALAMATRVGARALGFEQAGRIAEGAWADLIIVDLDRPHLQPLHDPIAQLVHAARAGDVRTTILDGELVYHEGEHRRLDVDAIVDEAGQAAVDLLESAGVEAEESWLTADRGSA